MNFELGEHTIQKAEPKKKGGKWPSKKEIHELPWKQPAKEQSPDTQWTDSSLRAVKKDSYAEGHARQAPTRSEQTLV